MEITPLKHRRLKRLQTILSFKISGTGLFLIGWLAFSRLTYYLRYPVYLVLAAFIIFMLYVLFTEKKFGWIISFFVLILIPSILLYTVYRNTDIFKYLAVVPLAALLFYCFLLRLSIMDWLHD